MKPVNQKAWLLILPVILCVAFSAILPLMTVVNYSVQDIISPERRVFVGTEWFNRWASCWPCRCRPRAGRPRRCWWWWRSRC